MQVHADNVQESHSRTWWNCSLQLMLFWSSKRTQILDATKCKALHSSCMQGMPWADVPMGKEPWAQTAVAVSAIPES